MHEVKEKIKPICEMKEKLVSWSKEEFEKGKECVDTQEMGAVVDMIKDLAKVEKDCYEAAYYKAIVEAMEEVDEDYDEDSPMGYNSHRSARTGRYTSGRSSRMGFNPIIHQKPYIDDYLDDGRMDWDKDYRLGYSSGRNGTMNGLSSRSGRSSSTTYDDPMMDDRHGRAFNEWKSARRHYTETQSPADREKMKMHASEHMADTIATVREIWDGADPELRKRMRTDFQNLMNELKD